jgi:CHRD domain-containing protein
VRPPIGALAIVLDTAKAGREEQVRRATAVTLGLIALLVALWAFAGPAAAAGKQVFRLTLTGADPDGSGTATVKVKPRKGEVCYRIRVQGIGEPHEPAPGLGSAHIHFLAGGGIAVDLEAEFTEVADDVFVAAGCVQDDRALLRGIRANPDAYYLNVHTMEFPGGAVQAPLAP